MMELTRLSTEPIYKVAVLVCKAIFNCKADVVCHLQMSFGFSAPIWGKASEIEMRMNGFNAECKISEGH